MESTRPLGHDPAAPEAAALPGAPAARRIGGRALGGARELLGSKTFLMALGAFSLMMSGALLNAATTAFFTGTQTVPTNNYVSSTVSLAAPTFTVFNATKLVPGDILDKQITVTNSSNIAVPYYLTTFATSSSTLDTNTTTQGLRMVLFRCGTETAPADCTSATTFQTVTGVMDQAATQTVTTSGGVPTAAGMSVSSNDLVFTSSAGNITAGGGATIASVPILTKNNANTQSKCSVASDGGCLLGGYNGVTVSNPTTTVVSGSNTISIPALSSVKGLGAGGGGSDTDRLLLYILAPSTGDNTVQTLTSTLTFALTAIQPAGTLNPSR